jgi:dipeptidyl-peptidase-4
MIFYHSGHKRFHRNCVKRNNFFYGWQWLEAASRLWLNQRISARVDREGFMRPIATRCFWIFILACCSSPLMAESGKPALTLHSIFTTDDFRSQRVDNLQWSADSSRFTYTRPDPVTGLLNIHEHEITSGKDRVLLAGKELVAGGQNVQMSGYGFAPDRQYLLITGPVTRTWDSILEAPHYVYNATDQSLAALAGGSPHLRNVFLSPAGTHVGYVLDNNLYVVDLKSGETQAVTTDGSADIWNGIFDYGSTEFGFTDAWKWSPDGSRVAFWRLDVTEVKVWWMIDELGKYPEVRPLKYPNTAEIHAVNRIGVFDLAGGTTTWMDVGDNPDDYIPCIEWSRNSRQVSIQRLSRDHDQLELLLADAGTGESKVIVTDRDPAWIDITRDLMFLQGEDSFVWTSEKSGYRHAYMYDYSGKAKQLTSGDWEISSLIGVDETHRWLYFYAKKDSFIDQHVYRVSLDGSGVEKLSGKAGWYEWALSPDRRHTIETWSDAATPPVISLRDSEGKSKEALWSNELAGLKKFSFPAPEFLQFVTDDGVVIDAYMIKPPDFDPSRKYPVIVWGYGNAGSQMVVNNWSGPCEGYREMPLWHRYMAEQGFIIFSMDNRTTAGRGKAAKNLTYGEYGKWAVLDQVQGARYLKSLPFVDAERLGFWGWSGGGYLAAAIMTKGAPHFKVGVSVAPVIDLVNYQAVGVERWMDQLEDNPEGYARVNLSNYADRLEGDLLLIHGTGDENVKYAFTLQFADALIKANKQFDMMVYPNEHHGIEGARLHIYTKIADYFKEKL